MHSHVSAVGQLHEALQSSIEGTHNLHASPLGRVSAPSDTVPAGQVAIASCADTIDEKAQTQNMSSNNEQLKPSGAVSPDSYNNDSDVKMPSLAIRTIGSEGERNAALHDRSQVDRGAEMHVIPSTASTSGTGARQITIGRADDADSSNYHQYHAPDHVSSSSTDKRKKAPASGKRRHKKKRNEMTAEELAEADRKRKRANVKSATESRQRRRAHLEQLRQEAGELQAANFALIRENQTLEYYINYQ